MFLYDILSMYLATMLSPYNLFDELYTQSFYSDTVNTCQPSPERDKETLKTFEAFPTPPLSPLQNLDIEKMNLDANQYDMHVEIPSLTSRLDPMWSCGSNDEASRIDIGYRSCDTKPMTLRTSTPSVDICLPETICYDPYAQVIAVEAVENAERQCQVADSLAESDEEIDVVSVAKICGRDESNREFLRGTNNNSVLSYVQSTHNYSKPGGQSSVSPKQRISPLRRTNQSLIRPSMKENQTDAISSELSAPEKRVKRALVDSDLRNSASVEVIDARTCVARLSHLDSPWFEGPGKRKQHNVLERKRRDDLKSSFVYLKGRVPSLCGVQRAPKVVILEAARNYICDLMSTEHSLLLELKRHKLTNRKLHDRLQTLQRDITRHKMEIET